MLRANPIIPACEVSNDRACDNTQVAAFQLAATPALRWGPKSPFCVHLPCICLPMIGAGVLHRRQARRPSAQDGRNKMNFEELNLAPAILKAVQEQGYPSPTPIQAQAIPVVLGGH